MSLIYNGTIQVHKLSTVVVMYDSFRNWEQIDLSEMSHTYVRARRDKYKQRLTYFFFLSEAFVLDFY